MRHHFFYKRSGVENTREVSAKKKRTATMPMLRIEPAAPARSRFQCRAVAEIALPTSENIDSAHYMIRQYNNMQHVVSGALQDRKNGCIRLQVSTRRAAKPASP